MSIIQSKGELQIGLGWEGSGCPVVVRGTTNEYRRALGQVARSDDIAVEIGSAAGITTVRLARICARTIGVDVQQSEVSKAIQYAEQQGFRTSLTDAEKGAAATTTTTRNTTVGKEDNIMSNAADSSGGNFASEQHHLTTEKPVVQFVVAKVGTDKECRPSLEPLGRVLAERGHSFRDVTLLAVDIAGTASLEVICPIIVSLRELLRPRITVVKSLSLRKLSNALRAGDELLSG
mmetsp:Transcript_19685/g.42409  ORF Transcript_19685/g.42409 Transcript_19685/m.42409 type:complete len:234 (+) Transcript_19685:185-886(+)